MLWGAVGALGVGIKLLYFMRCISDSNFLALGRHRWVICITMAFVMETYSIEAFDVGITSFGTDLFNKILGFNYILVHSTIRGKM